MYVQSTGGHPTLLYLAALTLLQAAFCHGVATKHSPCLLSCLHAVCPALPPVTRPNSAWPTSCLDHAPGMTCTASCNRFYTTPDAPTAVCGPDGKWGTVTGRCAKGKYKRHTCSGAL
jgi:hypothetical protein